MSGGAGETAFTATIPEPSLGLRERFALRRFLHGERAVAGPVTLGHRRIFILPNRRGLGWALLLVLQFLIALNYGSSLAFLLTFLLAGIALLTTLHTFRNLAGLRVRPGRTAPVFDGEAAVFEVHFDNASRAPRFGLYAGLQPEGPEVAFDVAAASTATVRLSTRTRGRGWLPMPTLALRTAYPLGIFRAWSPLNLQQRALVYPRPAPQGVAWPATQSGAGTLRQQNDGDEDFCGFQPYRPGDPLKRIYWKGVAKGQGVPVKQYAARQGGTLELDWRYTPGRDVESRLSLLCRWVLDAESSGTSYSLRLPEQTIPAGLGAVHRVRCLEALALFGR